MSVPRFSFYQYVDEIKSLLTTEFPVLNSVVFAISSDGEDMQFTDLGVPAFILMFEDPEVLGSGMDRETDEGFYMNVKINLAGYLVLPRFDEDADRNLDMSTARCQAATNIAARIFADAKGWRCAAAKIESIAFNSVDNYHIAVIRWSHEVQVGRGIDDGFNLRRAWGTFIACPDSTGETKLVFESEEE